MEIDKTLDKFKQMTNNSLENLKIANNKDKSLVNLINSTVNQSELKNFTSKNQIKELFSIEQLIATTTPSFNQLAIDKSSASCELVSKVKSNERFLSNLYNLSASELVAIKQLITGYRESAAFLLRSAQELEYLLFQQKN